MRYLAAFAENNGYGVDIFASDESLTRLKKDIRELKKWDIDPEKKVYIYELKEIV
jgi:hypothetical protein